MHKDLTARTAVRLRDVANAAAPLKMTVGLDAFVDEIIRVVDRRTSDTEFTTIEQIVELGTRIIGAAGQSTNLELVVERVKLGGNGPIMANALAALGPKVSCVGPLGEGSLHPAFEEMGRTSTLISLGAPGHTDALEFEDGRPCGAGQLDDDPSDVGDLGGDFDLAGRAACIPNAPLLF